MGCFVLVWFLGLFVCFVFGFFFNETHQDSVSDLKKNAIMELVKQLNSDKDPDLKFVCLGTLPVEQKQTSAGTVI